MYILVEDDRVEVKVIFCDWEEFFFGDEFVVELVVNIDIGEFDSIVVGKEVWELFYCDFWFFFLLVYGCWCWKVLYYDN